MNNVVNLIGRLGEAPACRTLNDGGRVANLSLATDDGYRSRDGAWVKRTTWHRLTVFGDKAVDYIETHYRKGDLIQFTGRLGYSQSERGETKYHNAQLIGTTSLLAAAPREDVRRTPDAPASARRRRQAGKHVDLDDEVPF